MGNIPFFNQIYIKVLGIIMAIILFYSGVMNFVLAPKMQNKLMDLEIKNAKSQLRQISTLIEYASDEFEEFKEHSLDDHKAVLISNTNIIIRLIEDYYTRVQNQELTEESAKNELINIISKFKLNNDHYYFIMDKNYKIIFHPNQKLIGADFTNIKDIKGKKFIKEMVDKTLKDKKAFTTYWWAKIKGKPYEKLSYTVLFEPWNWVIGSGVYIDNIQKEIQEKKKHLIKDLQAISNKIRISKSGYLYIFDGSGKMIIHPNKYVLGDIFATMKNPVTNNLIYK